VPPRFRLSSEKLGSDGRRRGHLALVGKPVALSQNSTHAFTQGQWPPSPCLHWVTAVVVIFHEPWTGALALALAHDAQFSIDSLTAADAHIIVRLLGILAVLLASPRPSLHVPHSDRCLGWSCCQTRRRAQTLLPACPPDPRLRPLHPRIPPITCSTCTLEVSCHSFSSPPFVVVSSSSVPSLFLRTEPLPPPPPPD
jgi:hypothetical protein